MGQSALDLLDRLDAPAPASLAAADDLLQQIAGDEIDRLLAESQDERCAFAPAPMPPSEAASTGAVVSPVADFPRTANAQATARASPVAAVLPDDPADDDLDGHTSTLSPAAFEVYAELDALLDDIRRSERNLRVEKPSVRVAAPVGVSPAAIGKGSDRDRFEPPVAGAQVASAGAPGAEGSDLLTSAAVREGLGLAGMSAEADAAEDRDAAKTPLEAAADSGRASWPVLLLERINAPLAFVPDRLRDALGGIAIFTLFNSLAVLIYVLFIRR